MSTLFVTVKDNEGAKIHNLLHEGYRIVHMSAAGYQYGTVCYVYLERQDECGVTDQQ